MDAVIASAILFAVLLAFAHFALMLNKNTAGNIWARRASWYGMWVLVTLMIVTTVVLFKKVGEVTSSG
jgi:hypothetical protein